MNFEFITSRKVQVGSTACLAAHPFVDQGCHRKANQLAELSDLVLFGHLASEILVRLKTRVHALLNKWHVSRVVPTLELEG